MCLCFFLSINRALRTVDAHFCQQQQQQQNHNHRTRSLQRSYGARCKRETSLKIIFLEEFEMRRCFFSPILSFIWRCNECEYAWLWTGMIMKLMNTYRRFRFIFPQRAKDQTQQFRAQKIVVECRKWNEIWPCLRRTWPPNNAIHTMPNNNIHRTKEKWKLSNLINNNVKKMNTNRAKKWSSLTR